MATYESATRWTFPGLFLLCEKLFYTGSLDGIEVFNHTHVVSRSVSCVNTFKVMTRKTVTLRTVGNFVIG